MSALVIPAALDAVTQRRWRVQHLRLPRVALLSRVPTSILAGAALLVTWLIATVLVPLLAGRDAEEVVHGARLLAPSMTYPFGTDSVGRDVLVRTVVALRYDLLVSFVSALAAAAAGVLLGVLSGTAPEWLDNAVMRLVDVIAAFPGFVLGIVVCVALRPSIPTLILTIALVLLPLHARATRAAILAERTKPYARAAHAMGFSPARIVFVHLLPNSLRPAVTQLALDVSNAIMITAALSFLGFGIQPPTPEWGLMMNEGAGYVVSGQWWLTFFPGLAILSLVLALFLIDDGVKHLQGAR